MKTSGPTWLYDFLWNKGLRGTNLRTAWVLGMREGRGDPSSQSHDRYRPGGNWTDTGEPYYDVGLYQINNRHAETVANRYDGDMREMLNVNKCYDMFQHLSDDMTNLLDWAIETDGVTFNWIQYESEDGWPYSWVPDTEANHAALLKTYPRYNINSLGESSNGWPILKVNDSRLDERKVPGIKNRKLRMHKKVLPLFLAFCSDLQNAVNLGIDSSPDDLSHIAKNSPQASSAVPKDNLCSGTAIWVNTRGSGRADLSSGSVYRFWLGQTALRGRLNQLLDSYDLIHWAGPTDWGGHTSASGNLPVEYPLGLFYLKSGVSEEDIADKMSVLNISKDGKRRGSLPSGPNNYS